MAAARVQECTRRGERRACTTGGRQRAFGEQHQTAGYGQRARARSCSSCAHCARIVLGSTTSVPPCGMGAGSPAAPPGAPASAQLSPTPPPVRPEPDPAAPPAAARSGASLAPAGGASDGGASAQAPAAGCAAARPRRRASRSLRMSAIMLTVLPRPCARRPARLRRAPPSTRLARARLARRLLAAARADSSAVFCCRNCGAASPLAGQSCQQLRSCDQLPRTAQCSHLIDSNPIIT